MPHIDRRIQEFSLFFSIETFIRQLLFAPEIWDDKKAQSQSRKKQYYDQNVDAPWIKCRISTFFEILFIINFFPVVWSDALSLFDAIFGFIRGMRKQFCHVNCIAVDILWAGISRMNNWSEMKKCMWVWILFSLLPNEARPKKTGERERHTQCWTVWHQHKYQTIASEHGQKGINSKTIFMLVVTSLQIFDNTIW